MKLDGKRVLVTGSSRGIGKAIALELAGRGAVVVVHGSSESEQLETAYADVRQRSPTSIKAVAQLHQSTAIASLFATIESQLGDLDVLINNAATQKAGPLIDLQEADWDFVMAVNLKAPFLCAQRAARLMRKNGHGGKIINISSVHSRDPRRNYAHYSAAKGGLEQLTRCLALELAEGNVQVNTLRLGAIATDLTPADRQAAIATAIPAERVGTAAEIARLAAYLSSADCDYMTGACITVDGGLTLGICASRRDL